MAIPDLPTPAVVVDLDRLEANLRSWQAAVTSAGPRFRPHIKTHKTVEIAVQQLELGASGIASAKVSEAEVFAAAGIRDIVIAYPVLGADKAERVARMAAGGTNMAVNVDSELGAEELSTAAARHGTRIGVQLEVDTGLNRVGFRPDETDRLESLARFVMSLPGLDLEGVTTHRGVGFEGASNMTPTEAGLAEGALLVEVAERLRASESPDPRGDGRRHYHRPSSCHRAGRHGGSGRNVCVQRPDAARLRVRRPRRPRADNPLHGRQPSR